MIIAKAPLRITFAGGGSDVAARIHKTNGRVLSMTIDVHVHMSVNRRRDSKVVASYAHVERVGGTGDVANALIRSALERHGVRHGIEVHSIGVLPLDACGMGGSGAAAVALLKALERLTGSYRAMSDLAEAAAAIEIHDMMRTVGKQDHYAAAYGGVNEFLFRGEEVSLGFQAATTIHDPNFLRGRMVLVPCLNGQRDASKALEVQFKDGMSTAHALMEPVDQAITAYKDQDVDGLISVLRRGWEVKRTLPGVAVASAAVIVERAQELGGGAKLNGAGGGGMIFALFPTEQTAQHFSSEYEGAFLVNPETRPALVVLDDGERL
mgnify:CR=1 FL=1